MTFLFRIITTALSIASLAALAAPAAMAASSKGVTPTPPKVSRDIPYSSTGIEALKLDVWSSASARTGQPVLMLLHGGGWQSGLRQQWEDHGWTVPFTRFGFVVVVPSYRLACPAGATEGLRGVDPALCGGRMSQSRQDVQNAINWTTQNVSRYGGDPDNIYVMGASAGAHLALVSAYGRRTSRAVKGVVAISPPADFDAIAREHQKLERAVSESIGCTYSECRAAWQQHSPLRLLTSSPRKVPTYLYVSRNDVLVPHKDVAALERSLDRRGVDVTLREPAFGGSGCHGPWSCDRMRVIRTPWHLRSDISLWLRTQVATQISSASTGKRSTSSGASQ